MQLIEVITTDKTSKDTLGSYDINLPLHALMFNTLYDQKPTVFAPRALNLLVQLPRLFQSTTWNL